MSQNDYAAGLDKQVPEHRADSYSNLASFAVNAEVRWVEEGHRAFFRSGPDRHFEIVSDSDPGVRYRLSVEARQVGGRYLIHVFCNCKSGQNRDHLPVPCKHAAGVARRMVREGFAVNDAGTFLLHPRLVPAPPTNCATCGKMLERPSEASVCGECALKTFTRGVR